MFGFNKKKKNAGYKFEMGYTVFVSLEIAGKNMRGRKVNNINRLI